MIGKILGKAATTAKATLRGIPLIAVLFLSQAFLLINAPAIVAPGEVENFRFTILMYMVLTVGSIVLSKSIPLTQSIEKTILGFTLGFVLTVVVLTAIKNIPKALFQQPFQLTGNLYWVVFMVLIVAVSEEIIFRAALPKILTPILAQVAFAGFHFSTYGGNPVMMGVAFVAGLVLYFIASRWGLEVAIGVHSSWNLVSINVFRIMLGMG